MAARGRRFPPGSVRRRGPQRWRLGGAPWSRPREGHPQPGSAHAETPGEVGARALCLPATFAVPARPASATGALFPAPTHAGVLQPVGTQRSRAPTSVDARLRVRSGNADGDQAHLRADLHTEVPALVCPHGRVHRHAHRPPVPAGVTERLVTLDRLPRDHGRVVVHGADRAALDHDRVCATDPDRKTPFLYAAPSR